jgi:two-component system LytT family response regulator
MLKCLLIDDEKHALSFLERMLLPYEQLDILGAFTNAQDGISLLKQEPVDVIFLDIEMRGKNGIEIAREIKQICPNAEIVFITAHSQFAVSAFDVGAVDYLLKPLQRDRIEAMIRTLVKRTTSQTSSSTLADKTADNLNAVKLKCFYRLDVLLLNGENASIRWRTQKSKELFAMLLHDRGKYVNRWHLIEMLWPELHPDKAAGLLHTSIYNVRKVIKDYLPGIHIHYENESYRLEIGPIEIDIMEWERGLHSLPELSEHTVALHKEQYQLYTGDYFETHDFYWAEKEAQRLRHLWCEHTLRLAGWLEQRGQDEECLACYHAIISRLPYKEDGYWGAMRIHAKQHDWHGLRKQYIELTTILEGELGVEPSSEIKEWYRLHMHNRNT